MKLDFSKIRPLDPNLMKDMLICLEEMTAEVRNDDVRRTLGLIAFLNEREFPESKLDRGSLLIAFNFRLEALNRLREEPEYYYWALRVGKNGESDRVDEVLIETAAAQPLVERDERPAFDPRTFFQKALELCEVEGRA